MDKSESRNSKRKSKRDQVPLYGQVDERTIQIVNQGDAYMGRFAVFAILIDVMVRGLPHNLAFINNNWDLMGIVIIGGLISTAYQIKYKVFLNDNRLKSFTFIGGMMALCAILAFIAVLQFL